jgi:hypothetical protein
MLDNKKYLKKLEILAQAWIKNKKSSSVEKTGIAYLSRYPHITKKIASDEKLLNAFFTWTLKEGKSAESFLNKHGWQNLDIIPREIFNSDDTAFGGQGRTNATIEHISDENGIIIGYKVRVPALSTILISENATPIMNKGPYMLIKPPSHSNCESSATI